MRFRKLALVVLGLLLAVAAAAPRLAALTTGSRLTLFTFNRPVALPGVALTPGTYAFEVQDPMDSGRIVVVRDRLRRVVFLGFTDRSARPAKWTGNRIVFDEAAAGAPTPIRAWYPADTDMGYEFVYPR
ncbi:MAG TPA: hypothetical protein VIW45_03085 [Vicinamibacterales bacterium]|jgi:hypothetical protein